MVRGARAGTPGTEVRTTSTASSAFLVARVGTDRTSQALQSEEERVAVAVRSVKERGFPDMCDGFPRQHHTCSLSLDADGQFQREPGSPVAVDGPLDAPGSLNDAGWDPPSRPRSFCRLCRCPGKPGPGHGARYSCFRFPACARHNASADEKRLGNTVRLRDHSDASFAWQTPTPAVPSTPEALFGLR